ncbi:MAG: sigma 54-interacting transcriptional regulator, partial [bacterium]
GDMAFSAQAKVLRVLQTGELTRVGGESPISVDVRVVAATNKDLQHAVREGTFREDLFFRLNVVPLVSPPLRARRADIPQLVRHFLGQVCAENGFRHKAIEPAVLDRLAAHDWPGNVRELRNAVERLVILSGDAITLDDLPPDLDGGGKAWVGDGAGELFAEGSLKDFREAAERAFVGARLEANDWNISRTADTLGLERTNLHKKLKSLGLERPS